MRRIKVLHLLTSLAPGGAETNLLALMKHFDQEKFEHAVAYGETGALETEFSGFGTQLIRLSERLLCLSTLLTIPAMVRKIERYAPDIIHSHLDLPNIVGLAAKRKLGCKLILHFHGNGIIPRKLLAGGGRSHWIWSIMKQAYRHCDLAIAICSYQVRFLRRIGIQDKYTVVIPNGINIDKNQAESGQKGSSYQFINVARFSQFKNHELLIKAFSIVSGEIPHASLALVGDGPLLPFIQELVKTHGLQERVKFMGMRRDVPDILATSNCFVLSSQWELHPITVLEAMRAGLPVISTDVGGVAETVVDGVSGLLVRSGDALGLANAMKRMVLHPDESLKMGSCGSELVREKYCNKIVAKRIEEEYSTLIS